ncbi:MAG: 30S ribosomal protein S20 [Anaerolineae bacterium]|nr:30S ribosomal protein S20 [Anaerolineae bacterium]MDW8099439.1 30S ribosomal protein S20 [Anaerolineae bacterium]
MANTKSALKRIRSSERKRLRNRIVRGQARTFVKNTRRAIEAGDLATAQQLLQKAISALDKAAEKGVIHRNNAARRKSRLMRAFNQAMKQAQAQA